jgi:hypothetical protein
MDQSGPRSEADRELLGRSVRREPRLDASADFSNQEGAVKPPRFRIAWGMVAVAIAALDFGAIRPFLGHRTNVLDQQRGILLLLGALPMAHVLAVGILVGQKRSGSRPRFIGFEAFGAMALAFFVVLASCCPREVVLPYLTSVLTLIQRTIGVDRHLVTIPIQLFVAVVLLGLPQLVLIRLVILYGDDLGHDCPDETEKDYV